jgi:cytochrome c oxidase subunit 4
MTHAASPRTYVIVLLALLVLTVVTTVVAHIDLGPGNAAVAMLIAVIKMLLVMLFFMHIRYEARLTRLFAGAGLLWLLFMIGLVMADVLSRNWR